MSITSFFTEAVGRFGAPRVAAPEPSSFPDVAEATPDVRRLIRDRRYCSILSSDNDVPFDDESQAFAWMALEHDMALVPGGDVQLSLDAVTVPASPVPSSEHDQWVTVDPIYLDRHCVTNEDYARFVRADGYRDARYWPAEILPNVLQFVDSTGCPGPKHWVDGEPPADRLEHPVVNVCWYEASAFAAWAGKRLPSSQEWQRGGTWPKAQGAGSSEIRYPWGNGFDPSKANLWASGIGDTVSASEFDAGSTPNGIRQLIGNVWEWVDAQFCPASDQGIEISLHEPMAELRGAAFDTYFHTQATCQFRTGQSLFFRGANIGFRCCISQSNLPACPKPDAEYHS